MRHQPFAVGAVTMKTESHMVVNAPHTHLIQCRGNHFQSVFPPGPFPVTKEKQKIMGSREFGRLAETAVYVVVFHGQLQVRFIQDFF